MANTNDTFGKAESYAYAELPISYSVRFWLFLISDILSILCCLFVLYQLLFIRNHRQALNNHVIIVLLVLDLIFECTTIPFIIHYYRMDGVWQIKRPFSQIWSFLSFGLFSTKTIVFAWCTIERHILIFHNRLLLNARKRLLFHYLPLTIVPLYSLIYYSLVIFYPFCEYLYYQSTINGVYIACFLVDPILSKFDLIVHQIIPVLIINIFTLGLFVRYIRQKANLRQSIEWRKQRKIIIQVISIFIVFAGLQFPWTILQLCSLLGFSLDSLGNTKNYMFFFGYYIIFLFPFVCCGTLPNFEKKLKQYLCCKNQPARVVPIPTPLNNDQNLNQ